MYLVLTKGITAILSAAVVFLIATALDELYLGGSLSVVCALAAFFSPVASLVLCLICVLLVMRCCGKRHDSAQGSGAVVRKAGGGNEPRYLITFIAGPLNGAAYSLTKATPKLDFGRDGSLCDVVFPPDTKGVGRHHCCVFLDHGDAVFMDYSSCGSYRHDNGQRIPKDTPLKLNTGSIIYLASDKVAFRITSD